MLKYKTTDIIELFSGKVGLSKKQAARRSRQIKKAGEGVYEILTPVQFKAGEVVALDNPDKVTLSKLEPTPETRKILKKIEDERVEALTKEKAKEMIEAEKDNKK